MINLIPTTNGVVKHADFRCDFLGVALRRVEPNTSIQRSRSGLCERVIRREETETEGLIYIYIYLYSYRVIEYADFEYDNK